MRIFSIVFAIVAGLLAPCVAAAQSADTTVYQLADGIVRPASAPNEGAKEAYLPIIMPSNHASNLLELPDGDLLCFFFSGTSEGHSGVSIAMSRLKHGSKQWTVPQVVSFHHGWSNQNPVPFLAPDGRLWLFHTSQKADQGEATSRVWAVTSGDQGYTWSEPKVFFSKPGSYDRQPIVLFHNEWLFPLYEMNSSGITHGAQGNVSVVKVSSDNGKTWKDCDVPDSGGLVQMNIIKLSDHHLIAFSRSRYADWIYEDSSSDGCDWSAPHPTQLPNNNASIQAIRLKDGHLVMAFNNTQATTHRGEPGGASREILSVALSEDNGKTWPWVRDVQAGGAPPRFLQGEKAEYSYPSILQSKDGMIRMSFTFRRETIKYLTFPEQWIKEGPPTKGVFQGDRKP